jgi:hypothetical protein
MSALACAGGEPGRFAPSITTAAAAFARALRAAAKKAVKHR